MRSADIVKNCREVALRVEISGEWGELGDTLRLAAAEIERLRSRLKFLNETQKLRAETLLSTGLEGETQRVVHLQRDWRQVVAERNADIARLTAEVERQRMTDAEQEALRGAVALYAANKMTNSAALLHALAARQGGGE